MNAPWERVGLDEDERTELMRRWLIPPLHNVNYDAVDLTPENSESRVDPGFLALDSSALLYCQPHSGDSARVRFFDSCGESLGDEVDVLGFIASAKAQKVPIPRGGFESVIAARRSRSIDYANIDIESMKDSEIEKIRLKGLPIGQLSRWTSCVAENPGELYRLTYNTILGPSTVYRSIVRAMSMYGKSDGWRNPYMNVEALGLDGVISLHKFPENQEESNIESSIIIQRS